MTTSLAVSLDCPGCAASAARTGPLTPLVTCSCGAEYVYAPREHPRASAPVLAPSPPPARARGEPLEHRLVRAFVSECLRYGASVCRVERQAQHDPQSLGARSALGPVLDTLATGILGSGCRGTRGVGRPPLADGVPATVDPLLAARYHALADDDRAVADGLVADGLGDTLAPVDCGRRDPVECTLAERLGLRLVDAAQAGRWLRKMVSGDSRPALTGARTEGERRLADAARAWFAA